MSNKRRKRRGVEKAATQLAIRNRRGAEKKGIPLAGDGRNFVASPASVGVRAYTAKHWGDS